VTSSFFAVAMRDVFGTAMTGRSRERPELAETAIALEIELGAVPCPGDGALVAELFEPLGYTVEVEPIELDPQFPDWGASPYFEVHLSATLRIAEVLSHLYVLLPVLDGDKHYFVDDEEIDKLMRHGAGWLEGHPRRELIARRYLKYQRGLFDDALERLEDEADDLADEELAPGEDTAPGEDRGAGEESGAGADADVEAPGDDEAPAPPPLRELRMDAVVEALVRSGARRVLDLGCGSGKLLRRLRRMRRFDEIVGVDVSREYLERAARRLRLVGWPDYQDERLKLYHGSLVYRDRRLEGFDAAALVEVIEHLEPAHLETMAEVVFGQMRPRVVIVTTPNREYNAQWESLPAGTMRHRDHRFEWTRGEFEAWAEQIGAEHGYAAYFRGIGEHVEGVGAPTQMGIFEIATWRRDTGRKV
jgi:3' terminal RNA ribose 2'-O-methyltransferase Hen1